MRNRNVALCLVLVAALLPLPGCSGHSGETYILVSNNIKIPYWQSAGAGFAHAEVEALAAASMVAATAAAGTTAEATGPAITVALVEAGITLEQVPTAVGAPTEACAVARHSCAAPTILGLQRAAEPVILRPDGIPSNDPRTVAQCLPTLVRQELAGLVQKRARATTRRHPTPPLPTDNGTASAPGTQARLWLQTVPA